MIDIQQFREQGYVCDSLENYSDLINFNDYGVLIHESELENIDIILKNISNEKILSLQKNGKEIYEEYFTYDGCFNKIINKMINKI